MLSVIKEITKKHSKTPIKHENNTHKNKTRSC